MINLRSDKVNGYRLICPIELSYKYIGSTQQVFLFSVRHLWNETVSSSVSYRPLLNEASYQTIILINYRKIMMHCSCCCFGSLGGDAVRRRFQLPPEVRLGSTTIPGLHHQRLLGVFARAFIQAGTKIGPYAGRRVWPWQLNFDHPHEVMHAETRLQNDFCGRY